MLKDEGIWHAFLLQAEEQAVLTDMSFYIQKRAHLLPKMNSPLTLRLT